VITEQSIPVSRQPMSQTAQSMTIRNVQAGSRTWESWLQFAFLATLIALLYGRILAGLVLNWGKDPNYSHGFLVLPACIWIVWTERKRLARVEVKPSWLGLAIVAGGLGMLALGAIGAELFLSRSSLIFLLAGLVIQFRGWRLFRAALFPWAILFLAIPLPAIIFNQIALPLQFEASRLASVMLELIGVPVLREGNIIHLPSLSLDVAEACSGLRSLVSLITLAVFYGYLVEPRISRRALLVLAAIPIAVLANGFRIMGSGFFGEYWSPEKAEGFFHMFSGLLIFFGSFGLLVGFHAVMSWLGRILARPAKWAA
jgi:exosortase